MNIEVKNRTVFDGVTEEHCLDDMPMINDFNYYDDRSYITNSMLGKLKESPQTLKEYLDSGVGISSTALIMGDALHKGILEPDKYKHNLVIWNEDMFPVKGKTLRTKENKVWLAQLQEMNIEKQLIHTKDFNTVESMIASIKGKPNAIKYLEDAVYEQISIAEINGVGMKSKGDILRNDEWLIDIKTTSDIRQDAFVDSCKKYGYYRQAAMYLEMFDKKRFGFLVVEKKAPYKVAFYEVTEESIQQGREELYVLLEEYKHYFRNEPQKIDEALITGFV
jgi:hypothetical protein